MNAEPSRSGLDVIHDAITDGLDIAEILGTMAAGGSRVDASCLEWLARKLSSTMSRANQIAADMKDSA